jgi:hypothetical protein
VTAFLSHTAFPGGRNLFPGASQQRHYHLVVGSTLDMCNYHKNKKILTILGAGDWGLLPLSHMATYDQLHKLVFHLKGRKAEMDIV